MPTPYVPAEAATAPPPVPSRGPLRRSSDQRWVAGVCGGIAEHLGFTPFAVRVAFLILGGLGVALPAYLFLWAVTPVDTAAAPVVRPGATGMPPPATGPGAEGPSAGSAESSWAWVVGLGLFLAAVGAAAFASRLGIDVRLDVLVPLFVVAGGVVVAWSHLDDARREQWLGIQGHGWVRVALGTTLAVVGILVLATRGKSIAVVWDALLATLAVLAGIAVIAAPLVLRLWAGLAHERARAARQEERADIAAHLHDSVLQTLALIQRRAEDPAQVHQLARAQERELRAWLYGGVSGSPDTLAAAVAQVAEEIEDLHGIPVDLVVTGDRPITERSQALTLALREALLNAVRHGAPPVTAYVEIGAREVEAFVRDRGPGFDLEAVPEDRLGVRQSILARMERNGGTARVRRRDDGTEIELRLPCDSDTEGITP